MALTFENIVYISFKGRLIEVDKIKEKYCITVDGIMTQKDIDAEDVMRYLGNAMHQELRNV